MPSFTLTSVTLLDKLRELSSRFSSTKIGASINLTADTQFVVYQEFGTATKFDPQEVDMPATHTPEGIEISPNSAQALRLPATSAYPEAFVVPSVPYEPWHIKPNPGARPKHFIGENKDELYRPAAELVMQALHDSSYDPTAAQSALVDTAMPVMQEQIAGLLEAALAPSDRDEGGKLNGGSPGDAFMTGTTIEPIS